MIAFDPASPGKLTYTSGECNTVVLFDILFVENEKNCILSKKTDIMLDLYLGLE